MSQHLTIAYMTARKDPKIEWFMDSLGNQLNDHTDFSCDLTVVDFHAKSRIGKETLSHIKVVPPKPCVWQGEHRLTKENWFAAANARNTALCLAQDGCIAYVDDLSVLMPGWLTNVRQAMSFNGITLGAYRKVKNLVVEKGNVISYDKDWPGGRDSRWNSGMDTGSVPCNGDMLYGCSLVAPVEALLTVGGWPEFVDGLSFEDVLMGQALENAGFRFNYNRNQFTLESDEHHHIEPPFKRSDYGISPNDKSHAALNIVKGGCKYFDNFYEGGIRKMREEVLSGKPFPVIQIPDREWFSGKLLSEL